MLEIVEELYGALEGIACAFGNHSEHECAENEPTQADEEKNGNNPL